jgi:hypothetical protein
MPSLVSYANTHIKQEKTLSKPHGKILFSTSAKEIEDFLVFRIPLEF